MRAHKSHHFDRSISSFQSSHRHRHRNRPNYKPFLSLLQFNFFAVLILTNINILEWLRIIETEWWKKAIWKRTQQPFVCPWLSFVICSFLRYSCYILLAIACMHSSISLLFISAVSFLPWYAVHATKVDAVLRLLLISWIYYCFCCCLSFSIFFVHI